MDFDGLHHNLMKKIDLSDKQAYEAIAVFHEWLCGADCGWMECQECGAGQAVERWLWQQKPKG